MYYMLGICLAFASLLALNALWSLAAAMTWRLIEQPARRWSSAARARLAFALRIGPAACSLVCVAALLLPAYVAHEPRHSTEVVSAKLALLSLPSICGIVLALWRGLATWRATRRLTADWLLYAEPISLDGITIPTYKLNRPLPVIAIVGAVRPRLFIAAHLFDTLEAEELAAAVLHEKAHLAARHNCKRVLMHACCDVLAILPCGHAFDRVWAEESEAAADEYAARVGGPAFTLSLAAALIKIARLVPEGAKPALRAGAHLIGESGAPIANRVQRLMRLVGKEMPNHPVTASAATLLGYSVLFSLFTLLPALVTQTHILKIIHVAIEHFVAALQ